MNKGIKIKHFSKMNKTFPVKRKVILVENDPLETLLNNIRQIRTAGTWLDKELINSQVTQSSS